MNPILIIEDEPDISLNLADILEIAGYDILTTNLGTRAIQLALDQQPWLIVCDIWLGRQMNGLEIWREVQKTKAIPFLFLTAQPEWLRKKMIEESLVLDVLAKPFHMQELLKKVKELEQLHNSNSL